MTMSKKNISILFISILFSFFPIISFAQNTSPVPAPGGTGITYECARGAPGECDFQDLVNAVQRVINWGRNFALMFSVIVIAYAGYIYMTSGGSQSERTRANQMLTKVAIGILFILGAWLIVTLILNSLGATNSAIQFR